MPDLRKARVAVTGASGFLGERLVRHLLPRCREVVAIARGAATGVLQDLRGAQILLADVTQAADLAPALAGVDVVFHLAGRSGASASAASPIADLDVNVGGLLTLLDVLTRIAPRARVVFPGSRLEYGTPQAVPVPESHPINPLSPYGLHKYLCELELALFARTSELRYAVARLTNPYGPWQSASARQYNVLNQMILTASNGGTITLYGDGSQVRDYIFVEDAVAALTRLGELDESVVVNVGSGTGISVRDAAETMVRIAGRGSIAFVPWPEPERRVETGDFIADISKMSSLGWKPQYAFEDGIAETIRYFSDAVR
ncbi:MAG: NAD-dependent epimerase/dehydratase family protein [Candidatus Eremiobacteraeota bacterium]|nr:NAD-dependent epimerase/dehydratase family protein [Candidatus Eremiobacteraeota bacterium]